MTRLSEANVLCGQRRRAAVFVNGFVDRHAGFGVPPFEAWRRKRPFGHMYVLNGFPDRKDPDIAPLGKRRLHGGGVGPRSDLVETVDHLYCWDGKIKSCMASCMYLSSLSPDAPWSPCPTPGWLGSPPDADRGRRAHTGASSWARLATAGAAPGAGLWTLRACRYLSVSTRVK